MGMHAQIHQLGPEVTIALSGQFRTPEMTQLAAILLHYRSRGCRSFVLDMSRMPPLCPTTQDTLNRLLGKAEVSAPQQLTGRAIRLLADSPAVRPQMDCGGCKQTAA